jgi:hypothetical protein
MDSGERASARLGQQMNDELNAACDDDWNAWGVAHAAFIAAKAACDVARAARTAALAAAKITDAARDAAMEKS